MSAAHDEGTSVCDESKDFKPSQAPGTLALHTTLALQCGRPDDALHWARQLAGTWQGSRSPRGRMPYDELLLVEAAYKAAVAPFRTALAGLRSDEDALRPYTVRGSAKRASASRAELRLVRQRLETLRAYTAEVVSKRHVSLTTELRELAAGIVRGLVPETESGRAATLAARIRVRALKIRADSLRYDCSLYNTPQDAAERKAMRQHHSATKLAYEQAEAACDGNDDSEHWWAPLSITDSDRLALALNVGVFYHDECDKREAACAHLSEVFDRAVVGMGRLLDPEYGVASAMLKELRGCLLKWTAATGGKKGSRSRRHN